MCFFKNFREMFNFRTLLFGFWWKSFDSYFIILSNIFNCSAKTHDEVWLDFSFLLFLLFEESAGQVHFFYGDNSSLFLLQFRDALFRRLRDGAQGPVRDESSLPKILHRISDDLIVFRSFGQSELGQLSEWDRRGHLESTFAGLFQVSGHDCTYIVFALNYNLTRIN